MLYKKIAVALIVFFVVSMASAYFFISKTTMEGPVLVGISSALGIVGAIAGWVSVSE